MKLSKISTKTEMIWEYFDKNRDFQKLRLKFFAKFWPILRFRKSLAEPTFSETLTRIKIFSNKIEIFEVFFFKSRFSYQFWPISSFPTVLTKYRYFLKFWPEWRFSKNFHQNEYFRKFGPKSRFSKNLDQNRDFWKFYTKFATFENFEKKSGFSKISIKLMIS